MYPTRCCLQCICMVSRPRSHSITYCCSIYQAAEVGSTASTVLLDYTKVCIITPMHDLVAGLVTWCASLPSYFAEHHNITSMF